MKTFTITAGIIKNPYIAESEEAALEQYATEAGYDSYSDLVEQHGEVDDIREQ